jgi:hypothetical protein
VFLVPRSVSALLPATGGTLSKQMADQPSCPMSHVLNPIDRWLPAWVALLVRCSLHCLLAQNGPACLSDGPSLAIPAHCAAGIPLQIVPQKAEPRAQGVRRALGDCAAVRPNRLAVQAQEGPVRGRGGCNSNPCLALTGCPPWVGWHGSPMHARMTGLSSVQFSSVQWV